MTKRATGTYNKTMKTGNGYLLVVEDDPDILNLLHTTLTFKGYRVVTARNGREGLDIVHAERPSIVIADIMMPQLDGFGLVHRLRINPLTRDIPVIFITATYVTEEDQEFALEIGATRFIQKPVDLQHLLSVVMQLLEHPHQGAAPASEQEPLNEFNFYAGYRQRLESKLDQRVKQIAREEHLLGTHPSEDEALLSSLHHAVKERDELMILLEQINNHLAKYGDPDP
jgi:DNA-binding response OmpR family regulator